MYVLLDTYSIPNNIWHIEYITYIYSTSSSTFLYHGLYNCSIKLVPNIASYTKIFNKTLSTGYKPSTRA